MLKQALEFAEENDLHFTYSTEHKRFYFYTDRLMSELINIGDWDQYNKETYKITKCKLKQSH